MECQLSYLFVTFLYTFFFFKLARGRFVRFHHLTFWVGNAKQVISRLPGTHSGVLYNT